YPDLRSHAPSVVVAGTRATTYSHRSFGERAVGFESGLPDDCARSRPKRTYPPSGPLHRSPFAVAPERRAQSSQDAKFGRILRACKSASSRDSRARRRAEETVRSAE